MQFSEKKNFVHHHLVYTETRRKQPLPNNFSLKIFHYFLKRTIIAVIILFDLNYPYLRVNCIGTLDCSSHSNTKYF